MPDEETIEQAREDERDGKSPSTQAGEFVHEEIEHVRQGKHGARSTKQAIAIGLSKARRAGVKLPAPKRGSRKTKQGARRDLKAARRKATGTPSRRRSAASERALKRESRATASRSALSRQARTSARRRTAAQRSRSARQAARTRKKK